MKVIKPSFSIQSVIAPDMLEQLEAYGRTCYQSHGNAKGSAKRFVKKLIDSGHESVIEHISVTVKIVCDRGVSHELVRHRLASFSQESTRYCNYSKDGFDNELTFIEPCFWKVGTPHGFEWIDVMQHAEEHYLRMIKNGATPQEARTVLPNSLKTELIMTANLREWRHIFRERTQPAAHPQMREIMIPMFTKFKELIPIVFDDIEVTQ